MIFNLLDLYSVKSGMGNKSRDDFDPSKFHYHIIMFKEIFNNSKLPDKEQLTTTVNLKPGELDRFDVREGDVFLTSSSETPDELAMSSVAMKDYPNTVYSGFAKRLRPLTKFTHHPYMRYWFRSRNFRDGIDSTVAMTTRANLNLSILAGINVDLPDFAVQSSIAKILSSLDDKIELNNKINKNLEEIAQTLYKRWFVDFEFPDENGEPYKSSGGEMVDSELGMIPKGWEVMPLGSSSVSELMGSGIKHFEGSKKYIATADVTNSSITNLNTEITYEDRPSRANMQPEVNSVWFAKMKDSRKLIRISNKSSYLIDKCILSTGFAGLKTFDSLNFIWTLILSQDFDDEKNNLCNGTTMQAINNKNINRIKIIVPDKVTLSKFESLTQSIFDLVESNAIQNAKLTKTRDELLPKLMSGEIEVPVEE